MRFLAVAGTIAMFTVGGGILGHGLPPVHHATETAAEWFIHISQSPLLGMAASVLMDAVTGIFAGVAAVLLLNLWLRVKPAPH
jgi:hypothetical protein